MPVPTSRALWLAASSLIPAALAVLSPAVAPFIWGFDAVLLALIALDFFLAPRAEYLHIKRQVEPVLSSGQRSQVRIELALAPGAPAVRGELRDWVSPGPLVSGHRQHFLVFDSTVLDWQLTPSTRGDVHFGPLTLRLTGPLGLCSRQQLVPLTQTAKVFPDLLTLSKDALALVRAARSSTGKASRHRAEGNAFESLREYRPGDDRRSIDWKATARRGKPLVRQYQPERNQHVLLLLDCGRHMAGEVAGRRKLDHAVDAVLRLAKVALDRGDVVGVLAFGSNVKQWLPPGKGSEHLRAIAQALYRVEAALEESNYGAAIDRAFAREARRALVIVFTDLLDRDAASALLARTQRLVPRHLPLIISLQDQALHRVAVDLPRDTRAAYERLVANWLERDTKTIVVKLQESGARVIRAPPSVFASAGANAYLDIKHAGLL